MAWIGHIRNMQNGGGRMRILRWVGRLFTGDNGSRIILFGVALVFFFAAAWPRPAFVAVFAYCLGMCASMLSFRITRWTMRREWLKKAADVDHFMVDGPMIHAAVDTIRPESGSSGPDLVLFLDSRLKQRLTEAGAPARLIQAIDDLDIYPVYLATAPQCEIPRAARTLRTIADGLMRQDSADKADLN